LPGPGHALEGEFVSNTDLTPAVPVKEAARKAHDVEQRIGRIARRRRDRLNMIRRLKRQGKLG
jgi:hypothetical protein